MEPPKEPADTKDQKKKSGCTPFLIRLAIGIAIVFALDFLISWIFRSSYPSDQITAALVPFQNGYLAPTDAYITAEGATSEFTTDIGAAGRFLGLCVIPFVGILILSAILYAIPPTRKLIDYTVHAMIVAWLILLVDAMFVPPIKTVFDRERKVMIIHKSEWMISGTTVEIPFSQVSDVGYEIHESSGMGHYDDVDYADIYVKTPTGKTVIGENQVGAHASTADKVPIAKERQQEIDQAIAAILAILGKDSK